jgi:hypothetical protein
MTASSRRTRPGLAVRRSSAKHQPGGQLTRTH